MWLQKQTQSNNNELEIVRHVGVRFAVALSTLDGAAALRV